MQAKTASMVESIFLENPPLPSPKNTPTAWSIKHSAAVETLVSKQHFNFMKQRFILILGYLFLVHKG